MEKASYEGVVIIRSLLKDLMARMLALKRDGQDVKSSVQIRELVTEASVLFIELRRENREILQEEDRIKLETEAAKAPIDHTTLQLHNLLYEKNHYVKAIKACKDFRSKYPDIDLVSEEAFFQDAPQELQSDPTLRNDLHKLMIQRLKFELHQRKELLKQREVVEARKKVLQENIANRRKFLGTLTSHLKTLKKATLPVQQQLGILHTKRSKQNSLAELLPPPLYILYTELLSHKEAFGEAIEVDVIGSGKDAVTMAKQHAMKEAGRRSAASNGGKRDEELPEDDDDTQRQRKRAKKSIDKESVEKDNIYQSHPLTVTVQIFDEKQRGSKLLTLKVEYLTKLNVLCVGEESTPPAGVSPAFSLANLFPNDYGLDLPTQTAKLRAGPGFIFDLRRLLRPYKWVQHLGGKDILPISPPTLQDKESQENLASNKQQNRVQNVMQQLRARRKAQIALKDQLDSFGKLRRPTVKADSSLPWTLHNFKATLQSWAQLDGINGKPSSTAATIANGAATPEIDTGKEDGELPSTGASEMDVTLNSSKLADETPSEIKTDGSPDRQSLVVKAREGSDQSNVTSLEGSSKMLVEARAAADEGEAVLDTQQDIEMGEATGHTVEDQIAGNMLGDKLPGTRIFRAVLRKESGTSGKRIELEAQAEIGVDYPTRAPVYHVRFISGVPERNLPVASDVDSATAAPSTIQGELRLVEVEVNTRVPKKLPARERNYTMAHQMLALMMHVANDAL